MITSLAIHGFALAAVILNPARIVEFTGDNRSAPGSEPLEIGFAVAPLPDPPVEDVAEEPVSASQIVKSRPPKSTPEVTDLVLPESMLASVGEVMIEPVETASLAHVTIESMAELPPGFEVPAQPEKTSPPAPKKAVKPTAAAPSAAPETFVDARIKRQIAVRYPDDARREGVEGTCLVEIQIDASGRVKNARIKKSSGDGRLDREALRAAQSFSFHAARRGAAAVASRAELPFRFVLR